MEYQLDTRDYRCPLPLLMTKKALVRLTAGDELVVLLSAESTVEEFRLLCEKQHCVLEVNAQHRQLKIRKIDN
ncbi:sulfurtransferase TusA family protein [Aggregatibacter kilianii]|uniref:sulfurtransferase TusA family protein n=1 Tax=Aggregatibacter kilianii TaxID=2025884 RepID=UPI000D65E01F|nr:sulfurtransferase TusA family protein [Aggregatibacter kilianii]